MSKIAIQTTLIAVGGVGMLALVFDLSRRGRLSLRYALGWVGVSFLLVLAAVVLAVVGGVGKSAPLTPTGLLAALAFSFLLLTTLQLSVSLSGHQEAIRELSEANALLEERLSRVEDAAGAEEAHR